MKKEQKCLIYSMINNLVISIIKVIGGIVFNLTSLFSDGLHTFSDFITDIISLISTKLSKKKPTKTHPFGFGKVEYLSNLFIGVIILILGIFIFINAFGKEVEVPNIKVLYIIFIAAILKLIAIIVMTKVGKKLNSQVLITSSEESKTDLYSSLGVSIIIVLLQFIDKVPVFRYADLIGTIIISFIIIKMALKIIITNSFSLIGEIEIEEDKISAINEFLKAYKGIEKSKVELIKYGNYYKLQLDLELDPKLTLRKVTNLENKIKQDIIRHRSLKIKHVEIYVTSKLN